MTEVCAPPAHTVNRMHAYVPLTYPKWNHFRLVPLSATFILLHALAGQRVVDRQGVIDWQVRSSTSFNGIAPEL